MRRWDNPNCGYQKGHKINLGKKHTKETKRKISLAHKGRMMSLEARKKLSEAKKGKPSPKGMLGKHLSEEHKRKLMKGLKSFYDKKGRKTYKRYIHFGNTKKYIKWRLLVFQRDNWICQTCGARSKSGEPVYLEAHHIRSWIKYPELRYKVDNGLTLCRNCHKFLHKFT